MIRDAAINSWARVILAMAWTPRIRCLTARSCAPMLSLPALLLPGRRHVPGDLLLADLVCADRFGRLVGDHQHGAAGHLEAPAELLDGVLERGHRVIRQLPGFPDRVIAALLIALQVIKELTLEPANVVDGHVVEVARGARPD